MQIGSDYAASSGKSEFKSQYASASRIPMKSQPKFEIKAESQLLNQAIRKLEMLLSQWRELFIEYYIFFFHQDLIFFNEISAINIK